jgi:hypothetical protein
MSVMIGRRLRQVLAVASLALAAGLPPAAAPAQGQAPRGSDLLEQYRNRNAVAGQQLENEIHDAVVDAQRLAQADPAKAVDRLKRALARLDDDTVLTPTRRDSLVRDLKERIRVYEANAARGPSRDGDKTVKDAVRKDAEDRRTADDEKVAQQISSIQALRKDGKYREATDLAADLGKRYPNNPAAQVAARTSAMSDRVAEERDYRAEFEKRALAQMRSPEKSSLLPKGDVEYPSREEWEKMGKRNKVALTEQEQAIMDALNTRIDIDVKEKRIEDVLDYFQDKFNINIIPDKAGMEQAGVGYDSTVSIKAKKLPLRTVLRKILGDLHLAFVVKEEHIQVTSVERAKAIMTTRVYYVGDLTGAFDMRFSPAFNQLQKAQAVGYLMDTIVRTIDPDSWQVNDRGGLGTIVYDPFRDSLIIKQSAEFHYALGGSLR